MNELTLQWTEGGQSRVETIRDRQPSKTPGIIRIGRDPDQCDLVLTDPTVSGLHAEVFFDPQQSRFFIRNLRETNPPLVDGVPLTQGDRPLQQGSRLRLGQVNLQVVNVSLEPPATYPATPAAAVIPAVEPSFPYKWVLIGSVLTAAVLGTIAAIAFRPPQQQASPTVTDSPTVAATESPTPLPTATPSEPTASPEPTTTAQTCYVVTAPNGLRVRSQPNGQDTGNLLQPGTEVTVTSQQAGWLQISVPISGWIAQEYISRDCSRAVRPTPAIVTPRSSPAPAAQRSPAASQGAPTKTLVWRCTCIRDTDCGSRQYPNTIRLESDKDPSNDNYTCRTQ